MFTSISALVRLGLVFTLVLSDALLCQAQVVTAGDVVAFFRGKGSQDVKDTLLLQEKSPAFKPKMVRLGDSLYIEATDKSFILNGGETRKIESLGVEQRAGWVNPSDKFTKSFRYSDGTPVKIVVTRREPVYEEKTVIEKKMVFGKEKDVETKVRTLKNFVPKKEIFYGLLEFNKVHDVCSSDPATRAYFISIGEKYLELARGGNISVVYEYYNCKPVKRKRMNKYQ